VASEYRPYEIGYLFARPNELTLEVRQADLAIASLLNEADDLALVRNVSTRVLASARRPWLSMSKPREVGGQTDETLAKCTRLTWSSSRFLTDLASDLSYRSGQFLRPVSEQHQNTSPSLALSMVYGGTTMVPSRREPADQPDGHRGATSRPSEPEPGSSRFPKESVRHGLALLGG
jgi:hypothetical protein